MPASPSLTQEKKYAHRVVRLRLLPATQAVAHQLAGQAGACRWLWNYMLARKRAEYQAYQNGEGAKPDVSFFGMGTEFTALRNSETYGWLQHYGHKEVKYTLKYLADAFKRFFAGEGHPRFKSKHHTQDGFTIPSHVKIHSSHLSVPKVGKLLLKGSNPYADSEPLQVRVRQEGSPTRPKWYAYVFYCVRVDAVKPGADHGILGLDRNAGQATDSAGTVYSMTDTSKLDTKIKRKQREKSRKQPGSNRSKRVTGQLRKLQRQSQQIRDNDTHHISRELADKAHTVVLEDLNTAAMTKSARGTVEKPGTNVKQKSGLNRVILGSNWYQLYQRLLYKCAAVAMVNPKHTSQMCHQCGCIDKRNRTSQAVFHCVSCGLRMHADHNAAINILVRYERTVARGTGATARREAFPTGTSKTREQDIRQWTRSKNHVY